MMLEAFGTELEKIAFLPFQSLKKGYRPNFAATAPKAPKLDPGKVPTIAVPMAARASAGTATNVRQLRGWTP
jgi:hypothetical protein